MKHSGRSNGFDGLNVRVFALLVLAFAWTPVVLAEEKPNFLLLLSDDHNYRTLGAARNAVLRTPHLDQLADEGVYFNRCFTPNPICQPSRASFHTGQSSWSNGVTFNGKPLKQESPLLVRAMAESGYEGKYTLYEEGIRSSLIVRHPGLRQG